MQQGGAVRLGALGLGLAELLLDHLHFLLVEQHRLLRGVDLVDDIVLFLLDHGVDSVLHGFQDGLQLVQTLDVGLRSVHLS